MKLKKIPVIYNEGECSNLCCSCLYESSPSCDFWLGITGIGYDDKGENIVVACDYFKESTLGSRFVYRRIIDERIRKCKKEVDK